MVATFEEYEHQDNLNEISKEKEDAKPPISVDTFGSNGGNDSETSGPETPAKEVVDNDNSSTLFYLVEHGSPRFLQPGERIVDASASYGDGSAVSGSRGITGGSHVGMDTGLPIGIFSVAP
ncbi:hypothetical protein Tco_1278047 [Tanacetum coccineum]